MPLGPVVPGPRSSVTGISFVRNRESPSPKTPNCSPPLRAVPLPEPLAVGPRKGGSYGTHMSPKRVGWQLFLSFTQLSRGVATSRHSPRLFLRSRARRREDGGEREKQREACARGRCRCVAWWPCRAVRPLSLFLSRAGGGRRNGRGGEVSARGGRGGRARRRHLHAGRGGGAGARARAHQRRYVPPGPVSPHHSPLGDYSPALRSAASRESVPLAGFLSRSARLDRGRAAGLSRASSVRSPFQQRSPVFVVDLVRS
jgi:hypothetical protein